MKRFLLILFSIVLVFSFAGCKSKADDTPVAPIDKQQGQITQTPDSKPAVTDTADTLPSDAGDFGTADRSFCRDDSAELFNVVLGVYPVDDTTAVLRFAYYDATDDIEIPLEKYYPFTCKLVNKATYVNDAADISACIDTEGNVKVNSSNEIYNDILGTYYSAGDPGMPDAETIVEFLRNIPAAGIGDFGMTDADDTIEECFTCAWFHEISMFRNGDLYKGFIATDDITGILECKNGSCELIWGNMDSTLEQINYFDIESDEEEDEVYSSIDMPIVFPYVYGGNELNVGEKSFVDIDSPYDIPYSFNVTSGDENIVSLSDNVLTAMAEGETELKVSLDYAGSVKEYSIPVSVMEYDSSIDSDDISEGEEGVSYWVDTISQRATMTLSIDENDTYSVDVFWADSVNTVHHWSFMGAPDDEDEFLVNLMGAYVLEEYDSEGNCIETILDNDICASLTYEDTGNLRWNVPSDEGIECLFEAIM